MNQTLPVSPAAGRIAAISASWHAAIVHRARDAFVAELGRQGRPATDIDLIDVPGAFEIPLLARRLALSGRYQAIAAFGLVVDGGIYRHDFVAHAVIDGLMRVQLDTGVPVFSAVLTPQAFHEHATHHAFFHEHLVAKGTELASACRATLTALRKLDALSA